MTPVIVVRPEPGCAATLAAAREFGLDARGYPLFAVQPVAWTPPPPDTIDALLIGSANALRHGGPALARYVDKPTYVVGTVTAAAAIGAGLAVVATGTGGLQPVLDAVVPAHRRVLRLAGRERVELVPPPGVELVERVVYASEPQPMADTLVALLAAPAIVLLHSAEAARHFAAECGRCAVDRGKLSLVTIGPRVAIAAMQGTEGGGGWAAVATAARPDDAALLALAARMCQTDDGTQAG